MEEAVRAMLERAKNKAEAKKSPKTKAESVVKNPVGKNAAAGRKPRPKAKGKATDRAMSKTGKPMAKAGGTGMVKARGDGHDDDDDDDAGDQEDEDDQEAASDWADDGRMAQGPGSGSEEMDGDDDDEASLVMLRKALTPGKSRC